MHEPLLAKFREHKAFAKKLARAIGRGEWSLAKNLEDAKPIARLDHLVKERYPTFTLALQDMQDPLNLVHLFSKLPTNPIPGRTVVPADTIAECARLINEWKLWAIKTHSLRKMFLGIKGIYYECDVPGHMGEMIRVRWLEAYDFQQHVPTDVDFRILLTFIELYRTLLSFVLHRLYTGENLVYPPPLDEEAEKKGETVGAFKLVEKSNNEAVAGKFSKKEVKRAIRGIRAADAGQGEAEGDVEMDGDEAEGGSAEDENEDFVERPAKTETNEDVVSAPLTTYNSLVASSSTSKPSLLFGPYTFYVSRECSPKTWEFVIRSMGGKAITSLSATSPELAKEADNITHVLVDRPMSNERMREMQGSRKWIWVQPQWVADCVNSGKIIGTEGYGPSELLPPHLSPWDGEGEVARPWLEEKVGEAVLDAADEDEDELPAEDGDDDEDDAEVEDEENADEEKAEPASYPPALLAAAADPTNPTLLRAAELEAETSGTPHTVFETQLKEAKKVVSASTKTKSNGKAKGKGEDDLRKIMMTNKKQRLYEKMKYSNAQQTEEVSLSELCTPRRRLTIAAEGEARAQTQGDREEEEARGQGIDTDSPSASARSSLSSPRICQVSASFPPSFVVMSHMGIVYCILHVQLL